MAHLAQIMVRDPLGLLIVAATWTAIAVAAFTITRGRK